MPLSRAAIRPGHHYYVSAAGGPGSSGCWRESEVAEKTVAKFFSTTSCLQSRIYLGFPRRNAKDSSSTFVVLSSLSSDLAFSNNLVCSRRRLQIHHRNNLNKKVRDFTGGQQRRYVRWCGSKSNSVPSELSEKQQQADQTVMMSTTSGSGRSERLSLIERIKRNPLIGFFQGASAAFSSNNSPPKNETLEMELGRLVLPALVARAVDPLALLLTTAYIGTFIAMR